MAGALEDANRCHELANPYQRNSLSICACNVLRDGDIVTTSHCDRNQKIMACLKPQNAQTLNSVSDKDWHHVCRACEEIERTKKHVLWPCGRPPHACRGLSHHACTRIQTIWSCNWEMIGFRDICDIRQSLTIHSLRSASTSTNVDIFGKLNIDSACRVLGSDRIGVGRSAVPIETVVPFRCVSLQVHVDTIYQHAKGLGLAQAHVWLQLFYQIKPLAQSSNLR